jgi:tRNA(fMet)-specific endonuclease VapC
MSELYMLDTDTCAFILRRTSDTHLARIQAVPVAQQVMSVVTYAELQYGVQVSSKKKGSMIGANALLIAAHARSLGATVVTNNTKDFERVKGLRVKNWMS